MNEDGGPGGSKGGKVGLGIGAGVVVGNLFKGEASGITTAINLFIKQMGPWVVLFAMAMLAIVALAVILHFRSQEIAEKEQTKRTEIKAKYKMEREPGRTDGNRQGQPLQQDEEGGGGKRRRVGRLLDKLKKMLGKND